MRRRRFRGTVHFSAFGLSPHAPFVPGETAEARHRRRYEVALAHLDTVQAWCRFRGVRLETKACMAHWPHFVWDFRVPGKFAQWRPALGKFKCKLDLHATEGYRVRIFDHEQLLLSLERWLAGVAV